MPGCTRPVASVYIATLQYTLSGGPLTIGRSISRAGTTTRVATRSAGTIGCVGVGAAVPGGGIVGRASVGEGVAATTISLGWADGVGSTAPVYVRRPPAISDTPTA